MKVVEHKPAPDADVIRTIEDMLEDAKQGRLQGLAAAGVNERGHVITIFAGTTMPFSQLGALQALSMAILIRDSDQVQKSLRQTLEL